MYGSSITQGRRQDAELGRHRHTHNTVETLIGYDNGGRKLSSRKSPTEKQIKDMLELTHDDEARSKLRQRLELGIRQIRRGKAESIFGNVRQNLQGGVWGKNDVMSRKEQMTRLKANDGATTSDKFTIASEATRYLSSLFDIAASDHDHERSRNMRMYTHRQYDLWREPGKYDMITLATVPQHDEAEEDFERRRHDMAGDMDGDNDGDNDTRQYTGDTGVYISAKMVERAIHSCKRRKECS